MSGKIRLNVKNLSVTTDSSGDGTASLGEPINGRLIGIVYGGEFDATADIVGVTDETGVTFLNGTNVAKAAAYWPLVVAVMTNDLSAQSSYDYYRIANETVTITVAQGGNAITGTFTLVYEE